MYVLLFRPSSRSTEIPFDATLYSTLEGNPISYDMATRLVLPTAEALDSGRRIEWISEEAGSRNDEKETLPSQHDRDPPTFAYQCSRYPPRRRPIYKSTDIHSKAP